MSSVRTQLIEAIGHRADARKPSNEPKVEIQGALRHLTALYERIRTLIDYQEERFIRRLAIRRILIRRILILGERGAMGETLLFELVRAAYLENGKVPLSMAAAIDEILAKYLTALPVIEKRYRAPELMRMQRRLLGIAAAEIEDFLNPAGVEYLLTEWLAQEIASYRDETVDDELRLVAMRALLRADAELAGWRLLRQPNSDVWKAFTTDPVKAVGSLMRELVKVEQRLQRPTVETRARQFHRLVPPYLILGDLAYHTPEEVAPLADEPGKLHNLIDSTIRKRLNHTERRIQRSMVRATVYIFLSKVVLGLPIEVAYDLGQHGHIAYFPLVVNTLLPPSLMLTASLSLRPPSPENSVVLTDRTELLFAGKELPKLEGLVRTRTINSKSLVAFAVLYGLMYLTVFGGLIWILKALQFNIVSSLVFFFFVSVVGFFAFRLRAAAKELAVLREREGIFLAIFDFFALPFLRLGRWLSVTARQLNIFLFFMDFVVEAPLKLVFVVLEDWFAFLREKREELR